MPATSIGLRLLGVRQSLVVYPAPFFPIRSTVLPCTVPTDRISAFSTLAAQNSCQHSVRVNRSTGTYNTVKTRYQYNRNLSISQKMAGNGEMRSKRKSSPVQVPGRPSKILRHDLYPGAVENGQILEENMYSMETDGDDRISLPPIAATADTAEWQATIERVVRNVVSIHFCQTCSFDTDPAISSEATGFVVDAEKGYILTNRHVVGAGPFWGYCIFDNHEEVSCENIYLVQSTDNGLLVRCLSCLPRSSP